MIVQWQKLHREAMTPTNAYGDDAGWDLHVMERTFIGEGRGVDVRTGLGIAIPPGFFGRIVGRSSSFRKRGLLVMEGTIDCGYRGELFSYCYCPPGEGHDNYDGTPGVWLDRGDSVAQIIFLAVPKITWHLVHDLPNHRRGKQGFGSSGH